MLELLIIWLGILSLVALLCRSALKGLQMYYQDRRAQRLERLDAALLPGDFDQRLLVGEIVETANERCTTSGVGIKVLDLLVERSLITKKRSDYVKT